MYFKTPTLLDFGQFLLSSDNYEVRIAIVKEFYFDFYIRTTLGVKEVLQSSKFSTSIFWRFIILHHSHSLKMCFRKKCVLEVHRMRACHAAGPGSIPGRDRFPEWGFFGVFPHLSDKCQETLGPQGPRISFGRRHHHSIFALLGWLSVCLVCIVFRVCAVTEVAPELGWSLIRGGPPCPCVVKKSMCLIHSLIPSPDRSWLRKARVAWVT